VPGYSSAAEEIFVQLLLSGTKIILARAMLTPGFVDTRSHFAGVSDFVETGSVENRNLSIFSLPPRQPYRFQRSKSLTLSPRLRVICMKSLPEVGCGDQEEVAGE